MNFVVVTYVIFYILPMFFYSLGIRAEVFRTPENIIFSCIAIFISMFVSMYGVKPFRLKKNIKIIDYIFSDRLAIVLSLIALPITLYFLKNFGIRFRHSGTAISSVKLFMVPFLLVTIWYKIYMVKRFIEYFFRNKRISYISDFLAIIVFLPAINSSLEIVYLTMLLLIYFHHYRQIPFSIGRELNLFSIGFLGPLFLVSLVAFGILNKVKDPEMGGVIELVVDTLLYVVPYRLSVWFYSAVTAIEKFQEYVANFQYLNDSLVSLNNFRLASLSGFDYRKPVLESINNFNYLNIFETSTLKERIGASPGIIASNYLNYFGIFSPVVGMLFSRFVYSVALTNDQCLKKNGFKLESRILVSIVLALILSNVISLGLAGFLVIGPQVFYLLSMFYFLTRLGSK